MKKHLTLATMTAIVFITGMCRAEDKKPKTLISDTTAVNYMTAAYDVCISNALPDQSIDARRAYCTCVVSVATANLIIVVQNHKLRFEEQLLSYTDELSLSLKQVNICKDKAK